MKKKIVKILVIVAGAVVLIAVVFAISIYNFTQKSEKLTGTQEAATAPARGQSFSVVGCGG